MWWFNLRASNTEPLLRLNVEAADERDHGAGARRRARDRPRRAPMTEQTSAAPTGGAVRTADRAVAARDPALPPVQGRARRRHRPDRARAAVHQPRVRAGLPGRRRHPRPPGRRSPFPHPLTPEHPPWRRSSTSRSSTTRSSIAARDSSQTLRALATAGAQVREAITLSTEARIDRVAGGERPRSVLVASLGGVAVVADVLELLAEPGSPVPVSVRRNLPLPGGSGRSTWSSRSRCPAGPGGRWPSPPRRPAAGRRC